MKHKAQDELYTLLCKALTNNEECEANRCTKDETCLSCDYKKAYDKLQDLINCQLTVDEVNKCLMALGHFEDDLDMGGGLTPLKIKIFKNIKYKLKKQKEMWEGK